MDPLSSIVGTMLSAATVYGVARAVHKLGRGPRLPASIRPRTKSKKLSHRRVTAEEVLGTR